MAVTRNSILCQGWPAWTGVLKLQSAVSDPNVVFRRTCEPKPFGHQICQPHVRPRHENIFRIIDRKRERIEADILSARQSPAFALIEIPAKIT